MQFWEGVHLALTQIRTEKLKSFFSVLGVVVGVMFLIIVVSVVEGMDRYVREDFSSQLSGINTLTVRRWSNEFIQIDRGDDVDWRERLRRPEVTLAEYEVLRDRMSGDGVLVGALAGVGGSIVGDNGLEVNGARSVAITSEMFEIRDWVVERGRPFSAQETVAGTAVAVIGTEIAELLYEGRDPIGRSIRVGAVPYRIVGVMEEKGSVFGQSLDNFLLVPIRSPARTRTGPRAPVSELTVKVPDPAMVPAAAIEIEGILRQERRLRPSESPNFAVDTAGERLGAWDTISTVLFTALPGLVGIALVVGGIVIMNIMLVSVLERTREIGVRKALGARRRDILLQVMIESATLSTIGAFAGVAIGITIVSTLAAVTILPAAVDIVWVTFGVGLGLVVGMVAGVYPAIRASGLDPVDALRYE
jgi:putative ABC transport system permease protein